jgi:hypothetical protein
MEEYIMNKFNVTISETAKGGVTYTNVSGSTKAEAMKKCLDDHRFIWAIEDGVELTATAKVMR